MDFNVILLDLDQSEEKMEKFSKRASSTEERSNQKVSASTAIKETGALVREGRGQVGKH